MSDQPPDASDDDGICPYCHRAPGPLAELCPQCAIRSIVSSSEFGWCASCTAQLRDVERDKHEAEKARQRDWWRRRGATWREEPRRAQGLPPTLPAPVRTVLTRATTAALVEAIAPGRSMRAALEAAVLGDGEALGRLYRKASSRIERHRRA